MPVCVCVCMCARACVSVGNFPLELNNMELQKKNVGQAVSMEQVLGIGQDPRDSQLLAASMCACVIHTHNSGWRVQCVLLLLLIILLFSWKLHTGINRSSRSSLSCCPGFQIKIQQRDCYSTWKC